MPLKRTLIHFENRLFELAATLMMIGLAALLVFWPSAIGASAFRFMLIVLSPTYVAVAFLTVGVSRVAALIANGQWPVYGPWLRAFGALVGASIWAQMDVALILLVPKAGTPPSPGIPVYFVLTIFELVSIYRALAGHGKAP